DVDGVDLHVCVGRDDRFGNVLGMAVIQTREDIDEFGLYRGTATSEEIPALPSHRHELDGLVLMLPDEQLRRTIDVGIECATKTTTCRNDKEKNTFFRPNF